jgi:hypothetical protein
MGFLYYLLIPGTLAPQEAVDSNPRNDNEELIVSFATIGSEGIPLRQALQPAFDG